MYGFTLIELVLTILFVGILAGITVKNVGSNVDSEKYEDTRQKLSLIKKAILGDHSIDGSGHRVNFGYVGDWGGLPSTMNLLVAAQAPTWAFNTTYGMGVGWKGPYLDSSLAGTNSTLDAWGRAIVPNTAVSPATWTSYGADGVAGGTLYDRDIVLNISPSQYRSTVYGTVLDSNSHPVPGGTVEIRYPVNGVLTAFTTTTDVNGYYTFANVPMGIRALTLTSSNPVVGPRLITIDQSTFVVPSTFFSPTVSSGGILLLDVNQYNGVSFPATGCAITTWTDISGYSHPGTLTNFGACPADGWRGAGTVASPYQLILDGTNDYVGNITVPGASFSDWTEIAWVKTASTAAGMVLTNRAVAGNASISMSVGWWNGAATNNGRPYFFLDSNGCAYGAIGTTNIADGKWHQIVGTRGGTFNYRIYVDGVLQGTNNISTGACSGTSANSASAWRIGHGAVWNKYFNGSVAYIAIYTRVFPVAEIVTICQALQGRYSASAICP